MKTTFIRRPSAAAAVMILALLVAAGGTATAAVRSQNGNHLISKHSLSGNRLRNNTVTGKQVKEKSLSEVPKAKNAKTVGGQRLVTFRKLVATGDTTQEKALSMSGLTLTMSCNSSGQPNVEAVSSVGGAFMRGTKIGTPGASFVGTSNATAGVPSTVFATTDGLGSFIVHYLTNSGTFVDVTAVVDDSNTIAGFVGCLVEGNAVVGG
jgi:hypothetical protein